MNGMQALKYWKEYFDNPTGGLLGFLVASYNLGGVTAIPFVALFSDRFGRRMSVIFGSVVMIVGAILQGLAQNCTFPLPPPPRCPADPPHPHLKTS